MMRTQTRLAIAKLAVFSAVSILCTGTLAAIMGNFGLGATREYAAVFTDASLLQKGDDVRVAGVVVGQVAGIEPAEANTALVTFDVSERVELTTASRAEIRYEDLVGSRYLVLERGGADAPALEEGDTIPVSRTVPALDLTALYNGFAPLFSALEPADVNALSRNLVQVLQGEGGTIESLLAHAASVSNAVADREQLVGDVIVNLNDVLGTVDQRHTQVTELIRELRRWMEQLSGDRLEIGRSVVHLSDMAETLASFVSEGRPLLKADIAELRTLATTLGTDKSRQVLEAVLKRMPEQYEDQTRTGTYGSWYNYYLCGARVSIEMPPSMVTPELQPLANELRDFAFESTAPRCD